MKANIVLQIMRLKELVVSFSCNVKCFFIKLNGFGYILNVKNCVSKFYHRVNYYCYSYCSICFVLLFFFRSPGISILLPFSFLPNFTSYIFYSCSFLLARSLSLRNQNDKLKEAIGNCIDLSLRP